MKKLVLLGLIAMMAGCKPSVSDEQIAKVLEDRPELILIAIEKYPEKVYTLR